MLKLLCVLSLATFSPMTAQVLAQSATSTFRVDRTGNQTNRLRQTTYRDGTTSSTNTVINRNGNGAYSGSSTHTNRVGKVTTTQFNGQVTKTPTGRTNTTTFSR
ncbi:MAG: hypothetical protein SFT94_00490 [Pseudanabaenaceae cyanobacterium bins.68]|nr:hypothetical protein [Pseudanabaenaceae cyanobacterium bins.68]